MAEVSRLKSQFLADALHSPQAQISEIRELHPNRLAEPDLVSIDPSGEILLFHALKDGFGLHAGQPLVWIDQSSGNNQ